MFPEDEWGNGLTKEQKSRTAINLWVSITEAREARDRKMKEQIGAKVE